MRYKIYNKMIQSAKIIGTGLATTGLIGRGRNRCSFGALIIGVARNPSLRGQLFSYAILGFAFAEATGLFALMMAFLLLYVA
jgi:F-type H+-transporting ATPase subunit c